MPKRYRNLRKGKPKRHRKKIGRYYKKANYMSTVKIPRSMNLVGDRALVPLTYMDSSNSSINNATQIFASRRWRPTSAYDIDPHLGSSAIPGYNEWAAFYRFYRVHAFKYTIRMVNQDTNTTLYCVASPTQTDPGDNVAAVSLIEYSGNPYSKFGLISARGGMDRVTLKGYVNCKKFVGSKSYDYDDNYASVINTSPANNIYLNFGIVSEGTSAALTNGVAYDLRIKLYVEFYERVPLTS